MRLLVTILMTLAIPLLYGIQEISTIHEVFEAFPQLDKQDLLVFDVDETLTISEDPLFHRGNINKHRVLYKESFRNLTPAQRVLLRDLSLLSQPTRLIEKESAQLIQSVQKSGAIVIALTGCLTGSFNQVPYLPSWRVNELERLGISFKGALKNLVPFEFSDLKPMYGSCPIYRDGIIFANGERNSKGEVLSAFLDISSLTPKQIVFVDDVIENLISVEEEMVKRKIPIACFFYTGAKGVITYEFDDEDELIKELMKAVNKTLVIHYESVTGSSEDEGIY